VKNRWGSTDKVPETNVSFWFYAGVAVRQMPVNQKRIMKMNHLKTLLITTLIALSCGCKTVPRSYETKTEVQPLPGSQHQYLVQFRLAEDKRDGRPPVPLTEPKIVLTAGEEGTLQIGDLANESGIFCTFLVTENDGRIETKVTALLKEKGREMFRGSNITVSKP
jgi:hypothetical protein